MPDLCLTKIFDNYTICLGVQASFFLLSALKGGTMKNVIVEKKQKIQCLLMVLKKIKKKVKKEQKENENWLDPIFKYYGENLPENTMSRGSRFQHIELDPTDVWRQKNFK